MLVAFQAENSLSVFSAQIVTSVSTTEDRMFGLLSTAQTALIPATVDYRLDLSKLSRDSFRWDEPTQVMTVTLPPVLVGTPNLDEARARYLRNGLFITANAQERMTRANSIAAGRDAVRQARNPQLIALARAAAKRAMAGNLEIVLASAGFDKASVSVRFADEPGDSERLDRSRSLGEVFDDRGAAVERREPAR